MREARASHRRCTSSTTVVDGSLDAGTRSPLMLALPARMTGGETARHNRLCDEGPSRRALFSLFLPARERGPPQREARGCKPQAIPKGRACASIPPIITSGHLRWNRVGAAGRVEADERRWCVLGRGCRREPPAYRSALITVPCPRGKSKLTSPPATARDHSHG